MDNKCENKILVLYKQHYREKYELPLQSQFSCMGYYDGISVFDAKDTYGSGLLKKKTNSPISSLWYSMQHLSSELNGRFSSQIVGMFRDRSEKDPHDEHVRWPFLAVCFLQLERHVDETVISRGLETLFSQNDDDVSVYVRAYLTFDNASIICICYSNSMYLLGHQVREIEHYSGVVYSHSIFGINEEYLKECSNRQGIKGVFLNRNVHIEEPIYNLSLRISHGGSFDFGAELLKILKTCDAIPGYEISGINEANFFYKQGHINSVIVIPESQVKSLIALLVNNGLGTHQNVLYERSLYSIETSFSVEKGKGIEEAQEYDAEPRDDYDWLNRASIMSESVDSCSWTEKEIKKYQGYANDGYDNDNDAAYSGYMGIVKTLNSVAQYENYEIGKELFYILYPAFDLFGSLVQDARGYRECEDVKKYVEVQEAIKTQTNVFIASINEVLYHTVHSDQLFFMLPGYSGVSYVIPQKLLIFYHWYCWSLIKALNDDDNTYQVMISPVMEDVARAIFLDFKIDRRDRVLYIKISQRAMSFPRHNMIVLCHEIGHYVGDQVRARKYRALEMCKAIGILISECSWARRREEYKSVKEVELLFGEMVSNLRRVTALRYAERLADRLVKMRPDNKFFYNDIEEELIVSARRMMLEEKDHIWREAVPSVMSLIGDLDSDLQEQFLFRYRSLMEDEKYNRADVVAGGRLDSVVLFIMAMFREVYADITAFEVLACKFEDYKESFAVSEGQRISDEDQDERVKLRLLIAKHLYFSDPYDDSIKRDMHSEEANQNLNHDPTIVREDRLNAFEFQSEFYKMSWLQDVLIEYAEHCRRNLRCELEKHEEVISAIRNMYQMFDGSRSDSAENIYREIVKRNRLYMTEVEELFDRVDKTVV